MLYRILILLILLLSAPAWGATYAPTTHAEMATAVAALATGDTITISGSWTATVAYTISPDNVTINSSSTSNTITAGDDDAAVFNLAGSGQTITGFQIDGDKDTVASTIGIDVSGSNATISSMVVFDAFYYSIRIYGGSTGNTITGCTLKNCGGTGINKNVYGNEIRVNASGRADVSNCAINNDGTGSHLIFLNEPAADGTISGNTMTGGTDGVQVVTGSGWTFSNNTVTNFGLSAHADAFNLTPCASCTVLKNTVTQSADTGNAVWGVEISGDANGCDDTTISGNTFSGNYLNRCVSGGGSYIVVEKNSCSAVEYGFLYENVDSSIFRFNLILMAGGTDEAAIFLHSNAAGERVAYVYNNTIIDTDATTYGVRFEETTGTWGAAAVKNNIIKGFAKGLVIEDAGDDGIAVVHQYNNYYGNTANAQKDVAGVFSAEALGTGEITTDPLLNDSYGLQGNSPAKDAGAVLYTYAAHPGDFLGAKVYGSAPDIGAIEYKDHTFGGWFFEMFIPTIFNLCGSTNANCYTQP